MHKMTLVLLSILLLSACAGAPKPPSCKGNHLRPANPSLYPAAAKSPDAAASYVCS